MGDGRGTIAHLSEASYSCRLTYSCRLKKQIEAKAKAKPNAVNASSRIPIGLTLACGKSKSSFERKTGDGRATIASLAKRAYCYIDFERSASTQAGTGLPARSCTPVETGGRAGRDTARTGIGASEATSAWWARSVS